MPSNPIRETPWFCWSLIALLIVGTSLRLAYINQTTFNLDEQIAQAVVQNLQFPNQWDTNWAKSNVTAMFRYDQYNFSSYHYLLYFWNSLVSRLSSDWLNHLGVWRALNALFGLVFLAAIALSLRRSVGETAALAATAAGAIIPLLIQDAHYLRCESMLTAGVAILLWLPAAPIFKSGWSLLGGGLIAGWMIASKATMIFALPLLLLLLPPATASSWRDWKSVIKLCGLIGCGCTLGIVIGMPGGVAQPHLYFTGLSKMAQQYNSPMPPYTSPDMAPSFRVTIAYLLGTLGWGFWIITVIGIGGMVRIAGWSRTAILCSPLVIALVFFGRHAYFAERSFSPFLPVAAVLFGVGAQITIQTLGRAHAALHALRGPVLVGLLTGTLALPATYAWQMVFQGFSGREKSENDAALIKMKGNLSGDFFAVRAAMITASDYEKIAETIQRKESLLVIVLDFNDPLTAPCLAVLQRVFHGRILGVRESLFPEIPPCTLHTFLSPRLWLVHIPASGAGGGVNHANPGDLSPVIN